MNQYMSESPHTEVDFFGHVVKRSVSYMYTDFINIRTICEVSLAQVILRSWCKNGGMKGKGQVKGHVQRTHGNG